jgi:TLC domain
MANPKNDSMTMWQDLENWDTSLMLLCASWLCQLLLWWLLDRVMERTIATYALLSEAKDRYEWRRRLLATLMQCVSVSLNVWPLQFVAEMNSDESVLGWNRTSGVGLTLLLSHYLLDALLYAVHPARRDSVKLGWIVHHAISALLIGVVVLLRRGAWLAGAFTIAGGTNVPSDIRWFLVKCHQNEALTSGNDLKRAKRCYQALTVVFVLAYFMLAIFPVVFLVYSIGESSGAGFVGVITQQMTVWCLLGTGIVFVPHVLLFFALVARESARFNRSIHISFKRQRHHHHHHHHRKDR